MISISINDPYQHQRSASESAIDEQHQHQWSASVSMISISINDQYQRPASPIEDQHQHQHQHQRSASVSIMKISKITSWGRKQLGTRSQWEAGPSEVLGGIRPRVAQIEDKRKMKLMVLVVL
jgi:hypothetical protein